MCNCKDIVNVKFAKVRENGIIPSKNNEDAGYDIYVDWNRLKDSSNTIDNKDYLTWYRDGMGSENPVLAIQEKSTTVILPTSIASCVSEDYYFQIQERGSTGSKGIKYGAGVIDSGYRGEWFIPITNTNNSFIAYYDDKAIDEERAKNFLEVLEIDEKNVVFYPMSKAICQAVLLPVPKTETEEISYEELKAIPSTRGEGALGSSNK